MDCSSLHCSNESFSSDDDSSSSSEGEERILFPIRVSPDRNSHRVSRDGHRRKGSSGSKLPVKERLYVSKKDIEHKKRMIHYDDPPSSRLRPSLADRLGPSPLGGRRYDRPRTRSRHYSGRPSKGNAFEIAKAYQRKKQQEVMRDDEVVKAKKLAKMLNEPDPKASSKKVEPFTEGPDKEQALDRRINEIKQQNKAIMRRDKEIRKDKELYS